MLLSRWNNKIGMFSCLSSPLPLAYHSLRYSFDCIDGTGLVIFIEHDVFSINATYLYDTTCPAEGKIGKIMAVPLVNTSYNWV
mmetsp:Transcript_26363/g.36798  ORF Transcript_26363/g.36798 Transcript_26363/m.36798 type:complete len:83 (+) Transcript_26363:680-928(+)